MADTQFIDRIVQQFRTWAWPANILLEGTACSMTSISSMQAAIGFDVYDPPSVFIVETEEPAIQKCCTVTSVLSEWPAPDKSTVDCECFDGQAERCVEANPQPEDEPESEKPALDHECAVCLEIFCQPLRLPCEHAFCRSCLMRTKHRRCPLCRAEHPASFDPFSAAVDTAIQQQLERQRPQELYDERLQEAAGDEGVPRCSSCSSSMVWTAQLAKGATGWECSQTALNGKWKCAVKSRQGLVCRDARNARWSCTKCQEDVCMTCYAAPRRLVDPRLVTPWAV